MYITPITLQQANHFAAQGRKKYRPLDKQVFSIGCAINGELIGAAIINYPASPDYNDGLTLEVHRIYSTAGRSAYCMLYGAAARAAKAMGFTKIITSHPSGIPDSSLRAAGWKCVGSVGECAFFKGVQSLLCYERKLIP